MLLIISILVPCYCSSVQKVISYADGFKAILHFVFYQIECIPFYADVFDPLEGEFCAEC